MKTNHLLTALVLSLTWLTPSVIDLHAADVFTKVTAEPGGVVGNSTGVAWGDYDNDGFIDLFVAQRGPGGSGSASQSLYHNNTDGTFSRVITGPVAVVVSHGVKKELDALVKGQSVLHNGAEVVLYSVQHHAATAINCRKKCVV